MEAVGRRSRGDRRGTVGRLRLVGRWLGLRRGRRRNRHVESKVGEAHRCRLPQQMMLDLVLGQSMVFQRGAKCRDVLIVLLLELVKHRLALTLPGPSVAPPPPFL